MRSDTYMSKINLQRGKLTVENRTSREKKRICSESCQMIGLFAVLELWLKILTLLPLHLGVICKLLQIFAITVCCFINESQFRVSKQFLKCFSFHSQTMHAFYHLRNFSLLLSATDVVLRRGRVFRPRPTFSFVTSSNLNATSLLVYSSKPAAPKLDTIATVQAATRISWSATVGYYIRHLVQIERVCDTHVFSCGSPTKSGRARTVEFGTYWTQWGQPVQCPAFSLRSAALFRLYSLSVASLSSTAAAAAAAAESVDRRRNSASQQHVGHNISK